MTVSTVLKILKRLSSKLVLDKAQLLDTLPCFRVLVFATHAKQYDDLVCLIATLPVFKKATVEHVVGSRILIRMSQVAN